MTPVAADKVGTVVGAIGEAIKLLSEDIPQNPRRARCLLEAIWPDLCDIERELIAPFDSDDEVA